MDDDDRMLRWEHRTELPLALASLLFLASYAVHVLGQGLSHFWHALCLAVTGATWALFIADYLVRWRISGQRLGFVHRHLLDTMVVILPLLRPLRVVKTYDAVQHRHGQPRLPLPLRVMAYASMSSVLLGFSSALAVLQQERGVPDATIRTFGDSVWWAAATLSTVGYGDVAPVTPLGRTIAVGMMACGLALLGAVTGSFSSWLLQVFARPEETEGPRSGDRSGGP
ncbi:potassium channel family protein [Streptomyces sp. NPDC059766]|uniref:potassium channel family protein n=1 Tax=Streptomyces sp. NPDC059766 TaxID=3346940 RepID=UPI00365D8B65